MTASNVQCLPQRRKFSPHHQQRLGLCHVSQLLKLLFAKYGIEDELDNEEVSQPLLFSVNHNESPSSVSPAPGEKAVAQGTFSWFQPSELTV
jgi:hypothetical protein